jgi:mRNA interferase RelE/StbE
MDSYRILWKKSAVKDLKGIPSHFVNKIFFVIESLKENPKQVNAKKLSGSKKNYRIRISDYRIIYTIEKSELIIQIVRIGHRKEIYMRK